MPAAAGPSCADPASPAAVITMSSLASYSPARLGSTTASEAPSQGTPVTRHPFQGTFADKLKPHQLDRLRILVAGRLPSSMEEVATGLCYAMPCYAMPCHTI